MKFTVENNILERQQSSCIVVGIFEMNQLSQIAKQLDKISNGYISKLISQGDLNGIIGQTLLLHRVPNILSERVLLVGCGKELELNENRYKKIIRKSIDIIRNTGSIEVLYFLNELNIKGRNMYWKIRQAIETIQDTFYDFDQFKTNKEKQRNNLSKLVFNLSNSNELTKCNYAIQHGLAISAGVKTAKDLGNMPPNICNPSYLASQARSLSNTFDKNIITNVIDEQQMHTLGMHAYLAVGSGSKNQSMMSIIEYKSDISQNVNPIVLVGKGLTFDSGGISIKPSKNMHTMKHDMCGAAVVLGVMQILAELRLPLNVIGILAGCENMIDSGSCRPGDILTTMSKKTVEILNTDAEGRLVLCDVLTFTERFKPETVIDIATLTGACVIALGNRITGLMSNYDPLANELILASEQSDDHVWRLPLDNEFQEQLKSNCADIANVGGQSAGAITAGYFLSYFAGKYHWAHLDIAGTAWCKDNTSATGRPVALLSQFLLNRAGFNIN